MIDFVKVGSVAEVFNGKTPAKSEQRDTGHPVLKIRDVDEFGQFRGGFESFVDTSFAGKHGGRHVKVGDTLILNAAHNASYVGSKTHLASSETANALATGEWLIIRCNSQLVDPAFMNYWIRSPSAREAIKFIVKGIHLYPKDVAELTMPLPLLSEQRRIVDILSRAESIVRLRREAQQKAAELVPAIFHEMFGDPGANRLRFPIKPLSLVSQVISGVAKGRTLDPTDVIEVPYMRVANVKDGYLDLSEVKNISIKRSEMDKLRIEVGDLLMTEGGDPDKLGRAALWNGEVDDCVHQNHIFKVRSDRRQIVPEYLKALAGSPYGKAYFLSVAKKTTGIASINKTQLSAFPVLVPPMQEQERFARFVSDAASIEAQQMSAKLRANAAFQALLARAFKP